MTSHPLEPATKETLVEDGIVLRVSEVKQRYFGGKMSLRWWYRQIELGLLPHIRAGGSILVCKADVEAFVAGAYQSERAAPATPSDVPASVPPDKPRSPLQGGLRFFRR